MPFKMQELAPKNRILQELVPLRQEICDIIHNRITQLLSVGLDKVFIPIQIADLDVLASILAYRLDLIVE
jgi:hypothetical protein